jgi:FkbM family methyltransferase
MRNKLKRVHTLGVSGIIRSVSWRFAQRFRPNILLTKQVTEGVFIKFSPQGNVSKQLYMGEFESDVVDFFSHNLKPGMVVFDLGANVGFYSLLSAKYIGDTGSVHAFEPTPDIFSRLRANVEFNGFMNININQLALADRCGSSVFYLYKQNAMNSLSIQDWIGNPINQIEVETITLDKYVQMRRLAKVDLIKIDVEGAELAVLRGGSKLLSGFNAPILICEFSEPPTRGFGHTTTSLRDFLETLGYQLFRWIPESEKLVPEPRHSNYKVHANLVCIKN